MAHDVFICYSATDKSVADALCAMLESRRIRCWMAPRDIVPGSDWGGAIIKAIDHCRMMVLIFSSHSNQSDQVKREVQNAVSAGIPVLPLRIEDVPLSDTMRYFLGTQHCLDALTPPVEQHFGGLIDAVERLLAQKGAHTAERPAGAERKEPDYSAPPDRMENSLGNRLVRIPERHLVEGCPPGQPFYVCATCVSNRDYLQFVRAGGPPPVLHKRHPKLRTWCGQECPDMLDHPVVFVTHEYARKFCDWLTEKERREGLISADQRYSLPSWKQWAAFSTGTLLTEKSVLGRTWVPGRRQPTELALSGEPSPLGLYHLFGNVFEWCSDETTREVKRRDGVKFKSPCNAAIGGGWASSSAWLVRSLRNKAYGAIWCPGGWPMKDGGFRICLVAGSSDEKRRSFPGRRRKTASKKKKKK